MSRPDELQTWLKSGKRSLDRVPVITDAYHYGTRWAKWWMAAQPQERDVQQWPPPRNAISDAGWHRFPAHGKDGLFIAVMALAWWAPAVQSLDEIAFFEQGVTDLHWVIQELTRVKKTRQLSPSSTLPPQDELVNVHQPAPAASRPKPTRTSNSVLRPPASSSTPRPSSSCPVSTSGVHTHSRTEGKRVVKPTWKAQAAG